MLAFLLFLSISFGFLRPRSLVASGSGNTVAADDIRDSFQWIGEYHGPFSRIATSKVELTKPTAVHLRVSARCRYGVQSPVSGTLNLYFLNVILCQPLRLSSFHIRSARLFYASCIESICAPLSNIACYLAYAHGLLAVSSAAFRDQWTQCLSGRTSSPSQTSS